MKRVSLIIILFILLVGAIGCDSALVEGRVVFRDGEPAQGSTVYIFKPNDRESFKQTTVNKDGNYKFNLPPGTYYVYAYDHNPETNFPVHLEYSQPSVIFTSLGEEITLVEHERTIVPTINCLRKIKVTCQGEFTKTTQPEFSWEVTPNVSYYLVNINSIYPYSGEYEEEIQTSATSIVWQTSLPNKYYMVSVKAYSAEDKELAEGYNEFWIGHRQSID